MIDIVEAQRSANIFSSLAGYVCFHDDGNFREVRKDEVGETSAEVWVFGAPTVLY